MHTIQTAHIYVCMFSMCRSIRFECETVSCISKYSGLCLKHCVVYWKEPTSCRIAWTHIHLIFLRLWCYLNDEMHTFQLSNWPYSNGIRIISISLELDSIQNFNRTAEIEQNYFNLITSWPWHLNQLHVVCNVIISNSTNRAVRWKKPTHICWIQCEQWDETAA